MEKADDLLLYGFMKCRYKLRFQKQPCRNSSTTLLVKKKEQEKNMFWWIVLGFILFLIALDLGGILVFGNIACPLR